MLNLLPIICLSSYAKVSPKLTSLTSKQKNELVDYVEDLIKAGHVKKDKNSTEEAFYVALDNIAGLDIAPHATRKMLVKELATALEKRKADESLTEARPALRSLTAEQKNA